MVDVGYFDIVDQIEILRWPAPAYQQIVAAPTGVDGYPG